jgi:nucleoside-diphosphate-sugar epimerase
LDVVQSMLLVATEAPGKGEVYNVASGKTHSIADLVYKISEVCGLKPSVLYSGQVRPGDAEKWEVDISRLCELGYKARFSLEEGLENVLRWYKQQPRVNPL